MTRDVLLAGITDADIRRETLGTADIHQLAINSIITVVESKEMARDALPSSSQYAMSTFKRSSPPTPSHQESHAKGHGDGSQKVPCPSCGHLYSPFTKLRMGWNTVPHKVCKECYLQQRRSTRNANKPSSQLTKTFSKSNAVNASTDDGIIIASATVPPTGHNHHYRGRRISLDHHIFTAGEWRRAKLRNHPRVTVNVSVGPSKILSHTHSTPVNAVTDSGAQSNIWSLKAFDAAGFQRSALSDVSLNLKAANSSGIHINGVFFATIEGNTPNGGIISCQ